jgi:hypothetical protein
MIGPQLLFHRSFTKRRRNARAADVVTEQNPLERRVARQQTAKFRQVHALTCLFQLLASRDGRRGLFFERDQQA